MTFRGICGGLLLSVLSATGCGTMANLAHSNSEDGGRIPFGGVKRDVAGIRKSSGEEPGPITHRKAKSEQYPHEVLTLLCAVDLPFSAVGDLLTWAYTSAYTTANEPVPVPPVTFASAPATLQLPPAPPPPKPTAMPPMKQFPPAMPPTDFVGPPAPQPEPAKLPSSK